MKYFYELIKDLTIKKWYYYYSVTLVFVQVTEERVKVASEGNGRGAWGVVTICAILVGGKVSRKTLASVVSWFFTYNADSKSKVKKIV